jgi:purine-nucleoside phosphorylase
MEPRESISASIRATAEIAKVVLMPGDPLRAKAVADQYMTDVVCFNEVRNMLGFTCTYKGKRISVMGHGMGIPSVGIYSYELFSQYDVEKIIRVGSAGSYSKDARIYDVVLVTGAVSESTYAKVQNGYDKDITYPDAGLVENLRSAAKELGIPVIEGNTHSSDVFYREDDGVRPTYWEKLRDERDCVCVEMESFALFHNANVLGKKAACILTISDSFVAPEITTPEERQTCFTNMMKIALEAIV